MKIAMSRFGNRQFGSNKQSILIANMFHLSHLLKAGVSVDDALDELLALPANYPLNIVWHAVARQVKQGSPLSSAMHAWPRVFDSALVAMVNAGENNGDLHDAVNRCVQLLQWQAGVKSRISSAVFYPLLSFFVLLGVVVFLMIFIVPDMQSFLLSNGVQLSWHTLALLQLSTWLNENFTLVAGCATTIIAGFAIYRKFSQRVQLYSDLLLLSLPLFGRLVVALSLSRYGSTCARLYGSGVALGQAMQISENVTANQVVKRSLAKARVDLLKGASLSASLQGVAHIPAVYVRLIVAGETSGALQAALEHASRYQQDFADHLLDRIETLIGPALLSVVGACLLWLILSLFAPVYQSAIDMVVAL